MKKLFAFGIISTLLLAGIALAGGFKTTTYLLDSSTDPGASYPTSASQGIPLVGPNGEPVQTVQVTVAAYHDGGTSGSLTGQWIWMGNVYAHVYKPSLVGPDGGAGWARAPEYDFFVDAGQSSGAPIQTQKANAHSKVLGTVSVPLPTGSASRMYFSTSNVTGNDAGTPVHRVMVEGRY